MICFLALDSIACLAVIKLIESPYNRTDICWLYKLEQFKKMAVGEGKLEDTSMMESIAEVTKQGITTSYELAGEQIIARRRNRRLVPEGVPLNSRLSGALSGNLDASIGVQTLWCW